MNAQNLFKDVQMLQLTGDTTEQTINNNDESVVVYIDDDDDDEIQSINSDSHPMDVKVDSEFNYDEEESNQSMVVEPDDQVVGNEVSIKREESDNEDKSISFKIEPPENIEIPEDLNEPLEEQFQLIDDVPSEEIIEIDKSTSSKNQSFDSNTSTLNDHSYSQSNFNERTSYCDDIVNAVLSQAELAENPNALKILSEYTNYLVFFTASEDPNSQVNQYVQKMKESLESKMIQISNLPSTSNINQTTTSASDNKNENEEQEKVAEEKSTEIGSVEKEAEIEENPELETNLKQQDSLELFTGNSYLEDDEFFSATIQDLISNYDQKNNENGENEEENDEMEKDKEQENMEISINNVKEEPECIIESSQENREEIVDQANDTPMDQEDIKPENDVEKLKIYIENASNLGNSFSNSFRDLTDLKYETDEDINNGKSKLLTSLKSVIKQSVKLMMEIENVEESKDIKMEDFIDDTLLTISKSYTERVVKSESDLDSDVDEEETDDDEINKLCNINNLKISNSKNERVAEKSETEVGGNKKLKKKKEKKTNGEDSDLLSSDDEDNYSNHSTKCKNEEEEEEAVNSSDEERKMVEKHESNCKNMLLVSSDENDSDESTYATSESSIVSESSYIVKKKKKGKVSKEKSKESDDEEKSEEEKEEEKEKLPAAPKEPSSPSSSPIDKKDESDTESVIESPSNESSKKFKKKPLIGPARDIFKKDFLDMDCSDSEEKKTTPSTTPKSSKSSTNAETDAPQTAAIDLTQFSTRQTETKNNDLAKYIQKMNEKSINEPVEHIKPPTPAAADDDECYIISSDSDSEVSSTIAEGKTRRRKELSPEELKEETKKAQKAEKERIKKLEKKKDVLSQYLSERLSQLSDNDDVICSNDLTLDYSKKFKEEIKVHSVLADQLKQHQKEGVKFMYDK